MSPVVAEAEVDINRSPEQVFDYCSEHRHEPDWNPMMTSRPGSRQPAQHREPDPSRRCEMRPIGTRPQAAEATMRERADVGIKTGWMYRGPTADPGHKAMRLVFTLTGNLPRRVQ